MYTVKQIANLAGVSARTIRYYDEIGLLCPSDMTHAGYRLYSEEDVDTLQQILFYRELGMGLDTIKVMMLDPNYDRVAALSHHRSHLLSSKKRIDAMLALLDQSIKYYEGSMTMTNQEKFETFKQNLIEDNDKKYGQEVSEKYGQDIYAASKKQVAKMTKEDFDKAESLAKAFIEEILVAFKKNDPRCPEALAAVNTHKAWLMYYWGTYNKEAHVGLGTMYVHVERFKAYYDQHQAGLSAFIAQVFEYYGTL